jgi:hypothetical protein
MEMNATTSIFATVVVLFTAAAVWMYTRRRRSWALRTQFGAEYDLLAHMIGRRDAEEELEQRARRVRRLQIRTLSADERLRDLWQQCQTMFADKPGDAVLSADTVVEELLRARGYPVGDFERQASDVSVYHPKLVGNYRSAHEVAKWHRRDLASTEDLRRAMIYYRALFDQLLEPPVETANEYELHAPSSHSAA